MPADIESMLAVAAPKAVHGVDVAAVRRRGARIRWRRRLIASALVLPLLGGLAWAGAGHDPFGSALPPAAPRHDACDDGLVAVFLRRAATRDDVARLIPRIRALEHVAGVRYLSQRQVTAEFVASNADRPEEWASLRWDSLHPTIRVAVSPRSSVSQVAQSIPRTSSVTDVKYAGRRADFGCLASSFDSLDARRASVVAELDALDDAADYSIVARARRVLRHERRRLQRKARHAAQSAP